MDKLTRLYKLHQTLLAHRQPVPMRVIQERLECSRATAARAIEEMRLYFDAPLEYVREANGYELEIPYSDDGELVMHILGHMPHVEVVSPPALRDEVIRRLRAGLNLNDAAGSLPCS